MVDVKNRQRAARIGAAVAAAVLTGGLGVGLAPSPAHAAPAAYTSGGGFTLPAGAPTPGAGYTIKNAYRVVAGVQNLAS